MTRFSCLLLLSGLLAPLLGSPCAADPVVPTGFVAYKPIERFPLPEIVLQYDPASKTGLPWVEPKPGDLSTLSGWAVAYLRDGLHRMTGRAYPVANKPDLSRGIVLVLLKYAPADIRDDAEIRQALKPDPRNPYAANEAFFLRSEKHRVLVVANTTDGLLDAVVELLESVDYEILGMGVDWIHVPDHTKTTLIFSIKRDGRPSFYHRRLWAHGGQSYGNGTIMAGLTDPADENVDVSYARWSIGSRFVSKSMPDFPGHALQEYHWKILNKMRELGVAEGFLAKMGIGLEANRPLASPEFTDHWWINTDSPGAPGHLKFSHCDGKAWQTSASQYYFGSIVDLSVPFVRQILLDDLQAKTEASFTANPDELYIFPMDAEDGAAANGALDQFMKYPNWYPEYRTQIGAPLGKPYLLNGFKGLVQPNETWDPYAASDQMFATADWLLREYDRYIDSLPKARQVTATGKSKKDLMRCNFQSYNYHDVPPNFNPNQRTRVNIAHFPAHRGRGKWENIVTQEDMARALQIMLPIEPSSDYRDLSEAAYWDVGPGGIAPTWSSDAASIASNYQRAYQAGFRSIVAELDLNFGKYGLGYYLTGKILWNAKQTAQELDRLRDRWFRRAFGSAWKEMKAYYDLMNPENFHPSAPNNWARAIRLIDAADKKIDSTREPAAQRRIDDVKQYWYYHYLMDTGLYTAASPEVKEFLWKGQMSYMVCMYMLARNHFNASQYAPVKDLAGEVSKGPAHYSHAETQVWWKKILQHWQVTRVINFAEGTLANGKPAKNVDLNDLVAVKECQSTTSDAPFYFDSGYMTCPSFLMIARKKGEELGFTLSWPFNPGDRYYSAKKLPYGVDIWNPKSKNWELWIDKAMTVKLSEEKTNAQGKKIQVVEVRMNAPRPGTYRFNFGYGGNLSLLSSPGCDPLTGKYIASIGFTYCTNAWGMTQSPAYLYIPRGTKSLDLEVWDTSRVKEVQLFTGLPTRGMTPTRKIDIHGLGTKTIALQPGEDGALAAITGDNFFFPYLYSVPTLWAKSPAALLIPRGIAEADGLTIVEK